MTGTAGTRGVREIRCGWGEEGLRAVGGGCDVVVIVDVLSFSTCVDVAVSRGAAVLPYAWKDDSAAAYAREHDAELAGERGGEGFSLSPASLLDVPAGTRILLPSPNGATLSLAPDGPAVVAGCLRNAAAVARAIAGLGQTVAVIPAGEIEADGSRRTAIEDLLGAGAIIYHLGGTRSDAASAAAEAFRSSRGDLRGAIAGGLSGRELVERGFADDVVVAADLDVSRTVPILRDGAYADSGTQPGAGAARPSG